MSKNAIQLKKILTDTINTICCNFQSFTRNPGKDFTRSRKISFRDVLMLFLCQEGGSLTTELFRYFRLNADIASESAFIQQRDKILPKAFIELFHKFTDAACPQILYNGLRLLAADGSDIHVPTNPDEPESYFPGAENQFHYNLLHLNALYDLNANVYLDAQIKGRHRYSEVQSLCEMVDRSAIQKALIIADRGYEAYELMAHIQKKGWFFLIRAKESYGIADGLNLPDSPEFDLSVNHSLHRRKDMDDCYRSVPLAFRLVRLRIAKNSYELLLTNLPSDRFSLKQLCDLYHLRWKIETSFRNLKYTLGMLHFHAKKTENILKEIFVRMLLYNFSSLAVLHSTILPNNRKHPCKVDFSVAVHLCRQFILGDISPSVLEALLLRHSLPIRTNRTFPRHPSIRKPVCFSYRIA